MRRQLAIQSTRWRRVAPYLVAPIVAIAAFALEALLELWLGHDAPLMVFVLAVSVASILGGLGPGVVVTAMCALAMALDFAPRGTLLVASPVDHVRIVLFVLSGVACAMLGGRRLRLERNARSVAERARQALQRERGARAEAERLARMRDEFLATISHELRTPLNAIVGWAELLADSHDSPETTARGLAIIRRNARAQADLVEDLLDTSSVMEGKLQLDVREVGLSDIVSDAIETVRHAATARGIELVFEGAPAAVWGDARRLRQVVWNLLANAVKFGRRGGEARARVRREGSDAIIEVSDDGRGIDPAFLPHVFEKFRQEDASITRQHGGLGLGLALSRSIVELHGGVISASSAGLGAGSTFTVRIPRALEQPRAAPNRIAVATYLGQLEGACVLVVDDDADSLDTAAAVLERAGARVVRARSGDEALAGISSGAIAAVVLDLMMPGRDGFEVLRAMREQGSGMPVIALTALAYPSDRTRTQRAGFAAHVTKPIQSNTLIDAVARSMNGGRTTTA